MTMRQALGSERISRHTINVNRNFAYADTCTGSVIVFHALRVTKFDKVACPPGAGFR
jgi:hypothetical protein